MTIKITKVIKKDPSILNGRYVYFKMSKIKFKTSSIVGLTPNKKYKLSQVCGNGLLSATIHTNGGYPVCILLTVSCALLVSKATWILAKESK